MTARQYIIIMAGAIVTAMMALLGAQQTGAPMAQRMTTDANVVLDNLGASVVNPRFSTANGWPSRHPELNGAEGLDEGLRSDIAHSIAAIRGVGGIRWSDGTMIAESSSRQLTPMHCQGDVQALLRSRTIRFEESSAAMATTSDPLLDEVATALRPCLGAIIAVIGHTDSSGPEPENVALSRERAVAVRRELIARGIPRDAMRASGVGSRTPVEGLDSADPANRRIEFSVIETAPIKPTPIDTPAPR